MRFDSLPLDEALGAILGHNVAGAGGKRRLRKGRALSAEDLATLRALGRETVWAARLDDTDVDENAAARRIADAAAGVGLRASRPRTGRVNLHAEALGVLRVDVARLTALNALEGVALATLRRHVVVDAGKMVATLKVLPYAMPEKTVAAAETVATTLSVQRLTHRRVGLVLCGSPSAEARIVQGYRDALQRRLERLGAVLGTTTFVATDGTRDEAHLADALRTQLGAPTGAPDLLILAGETAIQDRHDLAPRAIEHVGGTVIAFGAPVDPGNLLLLAEHGGTAILGAPGCARSRKTNVVDLVLPRLLVGDRLDAHDLAELAHGGLLDDVPERPMPRSSVSQHAARVR